MQLNWYISRITENKVLQSWFYKKANLFFFSFHFTLVMGNGFGNLQLCKSCGFLTPLIGYRTTVKTGFEIQLDCGHIQTLLDWKHIKHVGAFLALKSYQSWLLGDNRCCKRGCTGSVIENSLELEIRELSSNFSWVHLCPLTQKYPWERYESTST